MHRSTGGRACRATTHGGGAPTRHRGRGTQTEEAGVKAAEGAGEEDRRSASEAVRAVWILAAVVAAAAVMGVDRARNALCGKSFPHGTRVKVGIWWDAVEEAGG